MKSSLRRLVRSLVLIALGLMATELGYETLKRGSFDYIPKKGPTQIFSPTQGAAVFWALSWGMCIAGVLVVATAVYLGFRRTISPAKRVQQPTTQPAWLKHVWRSINVALAPLAFWTGYVEMALAKLRNTNPDQYLCLTLLAALPLFVLGTLYFSPCESFRGPSWDRSPFRWRRDPLQLLFIGTITALAWAVGSSLRVFGLGSVGYWTVAANWSIFVGLLFGQILAYAIFRRRITRA